jgi:type I restriction enzyme R subunit
MFNDELLFEKALVDLLTREKGWKEVIEYPTEKELLQNWANILFDNNRGIDRLSDYPLTESEMAQVIEQINKLRTPINLNGFINGKTITVIRDNPNDVAHFGKEIPLKIYDRHEIAAGNSRYQIARQPKFTARSSILNNRRGDLILLINGMPVIHIELKKSGVDISQACHQIEKYSHEGVFTGLFSLVQIFVAMTPDETLYFANPGMDGKFNKDYYFHWANFNNEPINRWEDIATHLLSIPMAHQLIGFYTVADDTDGVLKVLRSYQYYAASRISDRVAKLKWEEKDIYGGYIWHTTGSGKTMTSFKSAQLIANSKDADKVVFLVDRKELGTQSLQEYRAFAEETDDVQATENTYVLLSKLKSDKPSQTLIVTSIQKMSRIKEEYTNSSDIEIINGKRVVFIVDEAHRSTFGEMLGTIKETFPNAVYFGFTGTPIHDENQKKYNTTATVFGNELHRYSIADGIRDKNVLGFDPYKVLTYKDKDIRKAVALEQAKSASETEAQSDPEKRRAYYYYMDAKKVPMVGYRDDEGKYHKGIEDHLTEAQYQRVEHQDMVLEDIFDNWLTLSRNSKFHAIFATSSIQEAIQYYRKIKARKPELSIAAVFDPNEDNNGGAIFKEDALIEILQDYNRRYGMTFGLGTYDRYKKDISNRLAHKKPYISIENTPEKTIDLLIVVDQMLTGFDSKWLNTLYLDKVLRYENVVQAFSRTNRLFGPEKPHGIIRYYRKPHTMEKLIEVAFKLYSGDKPLGVFVDNLEKNLSIMNDMFDQISGVFTSAGIENFERLPDDLPSRAKFASLFKMLNNHLEAALIQGFTWKISEYSFQGSIIEMHLNQTTYLVLALRYKELYIPGDGPNLDVPYEIQGYLTEINTGAIDADYMNSRFEKYLKALQIGSPTIEQVLNDLHKTFATLSQEDQKYANIFLHDVQSGDVIVEEGKTLRDYITEYRTKAKDTQIHRFAMALGVDEASLREFMSKKVASHNINEYGRFDSLKESVDRLTAKRYLNQTDNAPIPNYMVMIRVDELLRKFILDGGFEINNID